jgi:hypothetical protein
MFWDSNLQLRGCYARILTTMPSGRYCERSIDKFLIIKIQKVNRKKKKYGNKNINVSQVNIPKQ